MLQSHPCFHSSPTHKSLNCHLCAQFHQDYSQNFFVLCHLWSIPLLRILCRNIMQPFIFLDGVTFGSLLPPSFVWSLLSLRSPLLYLFHHFGSLMPNCLSSSFHRVHKHCCSSNVHQTSCLPHSNRHTFTSTHKTRNLAITIAQHTLCCVHRLRSRHTYSNIHVHALHTFMLW